MSLTDPRKLRARVYQTQVDDSGGLPWHAEVGWPSGVGVGWIIFAETPSGAKSEAEAIEALYGALHLKLTNAGAGLKKLGGVMLEHGLRLDRAGRVVRLSRLGAAIAKAVRP